VGDEDQARAALAAAGIPCSDSELAHLTAAGTAIRARAAGLYQAVVDAEEPADVYPAAWDDPT
jgi:hypothetical protein